MDRGGSAGRPATSPRRATGLGYEEEAARPPQSRHPRGVVDTTQQRRCAVTLPTKAVSSDDLRFLRGFGVGCSASLGVRPAAERAGGRLGHQSAQLRTPAGNDCGNSARQTGEEPSVTSLSSSLAVAVVKIRGSRCLLALVCVTPSPEHERHSRRQHVQCSAKSSRRRRSRAASPSINGSTR